MAHRNRWFIYYYWTWWIFPWLYVANNQMVVLWPVNVLLYLLKISCILNSRIDSRSSPWQRDPRWWESGAPCSWWMAWSSRASCHHCMAMAKPFPEKVFSLSVPNLAVHILYIDIMYIYIYKCESLLIIHQQKYRDTWPLVIFDECALQSYTLSGTSSGYSIS